MHQDTLTLAPATGGAVHGGFDESRADNRAGDCFRGLFACKSPHPHRCFFFILLYSLFSSLKLSAPNNLCTF